MLEHIREQLTCLNNYEVVDAYYAIHVFIVAMAAVDSQVTPLLVEYYYTWIGAKRD